MQTKTLIEAADMAVEKSATYNFSASNQVVDISMIGITWRNVSGDTLNGTIVVYATNLAYDSDDWAVIETIVINSESNASDKTIVAITIPIEQIKVVYTPNDIADGILNVDIYGRDI